MKEIFKAIGHDNRYSISNYGSVKNNKTGRILRLSKNQCGYQTVVLLHNGKPKGYCVHRLVANAFIPNPNNYPVVNHKDEDKTNNRVDNLEWCTQKYNVNYGNSINKMVESRRRTMTSSSYIAKQEAEMYIKYLFPECRSSIKRNGCCIEVYGVIYANVAIAADTLGVTKNRISQLVKDGNAHWVNKHYEWYPSIM